MKYSSKYIPIQMLAEKKWRFVAMGSLILLLPFIVGACITNPKNKKNVMADRGFIFSHAKHVERGLDDCSTCHDKDATTAGLLSAPAHELCSVCHDIPEDQKDTKGCSLCHTRSDNTVSPKTPLIAGDIIFQHAPHLKKEDASCAQCHKDVDNEPLSQKVSMKVCMDCHEKNSQELNKCTVCHGKLNITVRPTSLGGRRIAHDSPQIWEQMHGREARNNQKACSICHDMSQKCDECHSKVAPKDHTVTWRRKTHGLRAEWDRTRCAACHEEDYCVRCHRDTTPASHRGSWGRPLNRHCVSCHYPEDRTNCVTCHENISHPTALPSPHDFGRIPGTCAPCHPMGLPHRAPHLMNSTVACNTCH